MEFSNLPFVGSWFAGVGCGLFFTEMRTFEEDLRGGRPARQSPGGGRLRLLAFSLQLAVLLAEAQVLLQTAHCQHPTADSVDFVQVVQKRTPTLTWTAPAPIVYGTTLGPAQLDASSTTPGVFTYAPATGTILHAGSYTLGGEFVPSDALDYSGGSATVSLIVEKATATVTLGNLQQPYTGNPTPVSVATQPSGLTVSVTYNGATSAPAAPGAYSVVATASDEDYIGSASGTLIVGAATPTVTLTANPSSTLAGSPVTLRATVSFSSEVPTGQVAFMDGAMAIGIATLSNGQAGLTTSALGVGQRVLSAMYGGDGRFSSAASPALTITIVDYSVTHGESADGSTGGAVTVYPGSTANLPIAMTATAGAALPLAATMTVSGLPPGAVASALPAQWQPAGTNIWRLAANTAFGQPVISVQAQALSAAAHQQSTRGPLLLPAACGLFLIVFTTRFRRRMNRSLWRLLVASGCMAGALELSGCNSPYGFFRAAPQNYTVTVTVASGTLSRSTAFTLTLE